MSPLYVEYYDEPALIQVVDNSFALDIGTLMRSGIAYLDDLAFDEMRKSLQVLVL
jgi:hypothetical protein